MNKSICSILKVPSGAIRFQWHACLPSIWPPRVSFTIDSIHFPHISHFNGDSLIHKLSLILFHQLIVIRFLRSQFAGIHFAQLFCFVYYSIHCLSACRVTLPIGTRIIGIESFSSQFAPIHPNEYVGAALSLSRVPPPIVFPPLIYRARKDEP